MKNIIIILLALVFFEAVVCFGWSEPTLLLGDSVRVSETCTAALWGYGFPFVGQVNYINGLYFAPANYETHSFDSILLIDSGDSIRNLSYDRWGWESSVVAYQKGDTAKLFSYYEYYDSEIVTDTNSVRWAMNKQFYQVRTGYIFCWGNDTLYYMDISDFLSDTLASPRTFPLPLPLGIRDVEISICTDWWDPIFLAGVIDSDTTCSVIIYTIDPDSGTCDNTTYYGYDEPFIAWNWGETSIYAVSVLPPYHIRNLSSGETIFTSEFPLHSPKALGTDVIGRFERSAMYVDYPIICCFDESGYIFGSIYYFEFDTLALVGTPIDLQVAGFDCENIYILWTDAYGLLWGINDYAICGGIEQEPEKIQYLSLAIFPNPFNLSCAISIDCIGAYSDMPLQIEIYDIMGNVVANTMSEQGSMLPRSQTTSRAFIWTPDKSISSGIYFVRARMNDGQAITKRIVYIR